ncbi:MAG TPA: nucleotidyltransferase domain-containing protein [Streptosporangiaceae bacterium]|nr:nucleotidyltransferase domain-containing protein [Streptosporangiaceae bacterium]
MPAEPVRLPDDVTGALAADSRITKIELTGSRARGAATALSDWDFAVTAERFDEVREALPETVRPLRPVVAQWDRLSHNWCYMLILAGPVKVDLMFGRPRPHEPAEAWRVNASTLAGIDDHFWDWALWLHSKLGRGDGMVALELRKMHDHLLGPMGVVRAPASLSEAVAAYRSARGTWERRLGSCVPRNAENAVFPVLPGQPAGGRRPSGR